MSFDSLKFAGVDLRGFPHVVFTPESTDFRDDLVSSRWAYYFENRDQSFEWSRVAATMPSILHTIVERHGVATEDDLKSDPLYQYFVAKSEAALNNVHGKGYFPTKYVATTVARHWLNRHALVGNFYETLLSRLIPTSRPTSFGDDFWRIRLDHFDITQSGPIGLDVTHISSRLPLSHQTGVATTLYLAQSTRRIGIFDANFVVPNRVLKPEAIIEIPVVPVFFPAIYKPYGSKFSELNLGDLFSRERLIEFNLDMIAQLYDDKKMDPYKGVLDFSKSYFSNLGSTSSDIE